MQNQLLIDDACVSATAEKQHMHKHLFVLEAASTHAQKCSILNMHSGIQHQMLLCSPVGKTLRLISNVCHHLQSATSIVKKGIPWLALIPRTSLTVKERSNVSLTAVPDALSHIQSLTHTEECGPALHVTLLLTLKGVVL